jgi:hypothetical protein
MFMNTYDIDDALQRWETHPVLGPASRTMAELRDAADDNSDGWTYWKAPQQAAQKLMTLIQGDGTNKYYSGPREDATPEALKAALRPIKSFRTRTGLSFTIVEELPAQPQPEPEPVIEKLLRRNIDLGSATIPPALVDLGIEGIRQVVAAAYLPPREGELPAHLVVYYRGNGNAPDTGVPAADRGWAVSVRVKKEDRSTYLTQGDYDLTFAAAMARFVQRVERQG